MIFAYIAIGAVVLIIGLILFSFIFGAFWALTLHFMRKCGITFNFIIYED